MYNQPFQSKSYGTIVTMAATGWFTEHMSYIIVTAVYRYFVNQLDVQTRLENLCVPAGIIAHSSTWANDVCPSVRGQIKCIPTAGQFTSNPTQERILFALYTGAITTHTHPPGQITRTHPRDK